MKIVKIPADAGAEATVLIGSYPDLYGQNEKKTGRSFFSLWEITTIYGHLIIDYDQLFFQYADYPSPFNGEVKYADVLAAANAANQSPSTSGMMNGKVRIVIQ